MGKYRNRLTSFSPYICLGRGKDTVQTIVFDIDRERHFMKHNVVHRLSIAYGFDISALSFVHGSLTQRTHRTKMDG